MHQQVEVEEFLQDQTLIQVDLEEAVVGEHQDLFVVEQEMLEDILHQKEIQVEQEYLHLLM